ncbi:MAG: ferredoxin--NADP reductase [Pseudomonadales bacterium]|nr:ferredoxin--NADP reductase [Pseudomonadales bacterium]
MSDLLQETVIAVHHWTDKLFSFTTTRHSSFRFQNGFFTMIGMMVDERPLLRAYSIASPNYEEHLEFLSIKVPDGPLTSRLQHIQPGDEILVNNKATGTLTPDHLLPGKNLYLISTGTGLAPFLSIIQGPKIYDRYDRIIITHGVRTVQELAYADKIKNELPNNEYFGDIIRKKLLYYPTVTREAFPNTGRLTDLFASNKLFDDLSMPLPDPERDRFMLCGSPGLLTDMKQLLQARGFRETRQGELGEYVVERAFVSQ